MSNATKQERDAEAALVAARRTLAQLEAEHERVLAQAAAARAAIDDAGGDDAGDVSSITAALEAHATKAATADLTAEALARRIATANNNVMQAQAAHRAAQVAVLRLEERTCNDVALATIRTLASQLSALGAVQGRLAGLGETADRRIYGQLRFDVARTLEHNGG